MTREEMESSIRLSVDRYRSLLDFLQEISDQNLQHPPTVLTIARRLEKLQTGIEEADQKLEAIPGTATHPLQRERKALMEKIDRQNRLIFPRLAAMMAVIKAELSQLKESQNALTGYRSRGDARGGRINNAC